ncbi:dihydrouridine synthase (Dus) domain-containing protein [Ditylenchus destructor]|uniref:Dihydrouridine synthase (Dus) domain-containing protein n=1 Tax=Ditylenchus destructor TaxID=166010 RepID=A0AAD4MUS3_9BILA|nr:dihydrouridine synthase (Dus) domain-containing protein [Ditylenchus destructor]
MNSNFNPELYANKIALGPMVRAGRTPLRMLALEYGADLVYTEEIVDEKLLKTKRVVNELLGCVDYTIDNNIELRVAKEEAQKCILQIGTNSAEKAVKICKKFGQDVAAIDVNMGCPKPFSTHQGMGAALLAQPEKVKEILTSMVANSQVPVSCKIRVLNEREKTLEFAKMIQSCGVSAIGVHGRRKDERPSNTNRIDEIRDVSNSLSIPVLAKYVSFVLMSFAL